MPRNQPWTLALSIGIVLGLLFWWLLKNSDQSLARLDLVAELRSYVDRVGGANDAKLVLGYPAKIPRGTSILQSAPPAGILPFQAAAVRRPLGVFKVTGYSDSSMLNGTDGRGITKSGIRTRWGIVAIDPKVIPLGSKLAIVGLGNTVFDALDTGGGIRDRWIDVWYPNDQEALSHGVQYLPVYVVADP